jgi:hypothetical protein
LAGGDDSDPAIAGPARRALDAADPGGAVPKASVWDNEATVGSWRAGRPPLIINEVGYIPFGPEAASLFFHLVSSRYERASRIVTPNEPFGR